MVTIVDYRAHESSEGKPFFSLVLQGDMEMVKSKESGRFYATARKATISSTFSEEVCKQMVGKTLKGTIVKVETEPYEYVAKETGEVLTLHHRYEYVPEAENIEEEVFS